MHQLLDLIKQYGDLFYLITFIWTALEGETFVIFAGIAAQKGLLNVYALFAAAWLGSMTGDQIFFFIGRRFGTKILQKTPKLKPQVDKALGWIARYAVAYILIYRFLYGIRNISGIALGMSNIPWRKFAIWNVVAAALWSFVFVGAGYQFGRIIKKMSKGSEDNLVAYLIHLTLGILALVALLLLLRYLLRKLQNALERD